MSENTQTMESKSDSEQEEQGEQKQEQEEEQEGEQREPEQQGEQRPVNLLTVDIKNENTALNVLVGFLGLAQKRGTFALNEAAKIHECVMVFQKNQ
jgi:hypothetical protein